MSANYCLRSEPGEVGAEQSEKAAPSRSEQVSKEGDAETYKPTTRG